MCFVIKSMRMLPDYGEKLIIVILKNIDVRKSVGLLTWQWGKHQTVTVSTWANLLMRSVWMLAESILRPDSWEKTISSSLVALGVNPCHEWRGWVGGGGKDDIIMICCFIDDRLFIANTIFVSICNTIEGLESSCLKQKHFRDRLIVWAVIYNVDDKIFF